MPLPRPTLDRLKTQHEVVGILISGLSKSELKFRPIPEKWSVHENIAHLTCYQPRVVARTQKILDEDNPSFPAYIPEDDSEFPDFLAMSIEELISHLNTMRMELVDLISNLTDEQLKRTGSHAKFGKMNVIEWTEFFLLHEAHHLHTIFRLTRSIKKL
ncbi:MAG: hypothetical protein A2315_01450 [Ignavibacteria bacterium RIFOXYB2_FULL_35_12]|nr:MAG: hypothetical protein A2058_13855 [Ignavibacteria bacterium GWA2_36_19]OGU50341.1 MAG: hypothetical protein A2006_07820 [Ignavibacteria bacterium GWC2_35_8]OGU62622.1 MAG: hypothetical protein A2X60_08105 [Ignavibacteria bacterium GWF2_35_20]OGU79680.1 MAG: hypothetical protein A2254_00950 [Ignavibacteria bacterium RIFOXYA2_FULL_35_9]OGU89663.1 MAG: hypothetical protein A3K31_15915 [Ignavibacteria bacterium RIFOXYA12_FULL_35_25]OGU94641.1 MAG: hypothetical protein A2347_03245 [Ignavibac